MTQREQIKHSDKAYVLCLNENTRGDTMRYSIYLLRKDLLTAIKQGKCVGSPLEVIWPDSPEDEKQLIHYQVYSQRRQYPAFHFVINEVGTSHQFRIETTLRKINPKIEVYMLRGHSPSQR